MRAKLEFLSLTILNMYQRIKNITGHCCHPERKFWNLPNTDGTLEEILKVFEGEKISIDSVLKSELSLKQTHHDFEDLRRELISRKYSYTQSVA